MTRWIRLPEGRVALLTKIHHSVVDGVSGNEILTVLLDPSPEGVGETALDAFERALACDPMSAYGGVVVFKGDQRHSYANPFAAPASGPSASHLSWDSAVEISDGMGGSATAVVTVVVMVAVMVVRLLVMMTVFVSHRPAP